MPIEFTLDKAVPAEAGAVALGCAAIVSTRPSRPTGSTATS